MFVCFMQYMTATHIQWLEYLKCVLMVHGLVCVLIVLILRIPMYNIKLNLLVMCWNIQVSYDEGQIDYWILVVQSKVLCTCNTTVSTLLAAWSYSKPLVPLKNNIEHVHTYSTCWTYMMTSNEMFLFVYVKWCIV